MFILLVRPWRVKSLWVQLSLLVWLFVISSLFLEPLPSGAPAPQLVCCPATCAQVHRLIALESTASSSPEPAPEPPSSSTVSPYVEHEPTYQVWLIPEERPLQQSSRDVTKALRTLFRSWLEEKDLILEILHRCKEQPEQHEQPSTLGRQNIVLRMIMIKGHGWILLEHFYIKECNSWRVVQRPPQVSKRHHIKCCA